MYQFVDSLNKLSSLLGDGDDSASAMFPSAIRKKELNVAEWQFAQDAKDLMGYESGTLDSTGVIVVPDDWIETYVLIVNGRVITNDREISLTDIERYSSYNGNYPYYYFWTDTAGSLNINLIGSVENLEFKLYYFKKPTTELSADEDISLHPEQFRIATAYHAASELMRQIGKNSIADEYHRVYEANVIRANEWARKLYINKEYAVPDLGDIPNITTDTQGQGYIY